MEPDRVSRLVADVSLLHTGIDHTSKALGARLLHLSDLVQRHYSAVCSQFGVSLTGHSVLTTLRRHAPRQLTLSEINRDALVTSGGMTFVVRQLEKQGLVLRRPHPDDRRASLLRLSPKGRRVADRIIVAVAAADTSIARELGKIDSAAAEHLLRELQRSVESVMQPSPHEG
jgi:DNA-binding MarR family transcriptional regulator